MKPLNMEELSSSPPQLQVPSTGIYSGGFAGKTSSKNLLNIENNSIEEGEGKILKIYFEDFAKNQKLLEKLRLSKVKSAISLRKVLGYNDKIKTIVLTSEYCDNK